MCGLRTTHRRCWGFKSHRFDDEVDVMRRQPSEGKVSRAVLALLNGPAGTDRRVLGWYATDEKLAAVDPGARVWTGPIPADELAPRRRARAAART
jgi:hypothetical protein